MISLTQNILKKKQTATLIAFLAVAAHVVLLLDSARKNSVTIDEVAHLGSGVSIWQTGSYAAYRVNPPLSRMLATIPVLLANPDSDYHNLVNRPGHRPEWDVGHDFIEKNVARYHELVILSRLAGIVWSVIGAWLIYCWATELSGPWSGCFAVVLWSFDPTILTFGHLLTPDMAATVCGLAATFAFRNFFKQPTWLNASILGILLGLAELTKFSMLILYFIFTFLLFLKIFLNWFSLTQSKIKLVCKRNKTLFVRVGHLTPELKSTFKRNTIALFLQISFSFFISVDVINLCYQFNGFGQPLANYNFVSKTFASLSNPSWFSQIPIPLPSDFLLGIDLQKRDFEMEMPSYLAGEWRNQGWWYYYILAFLLKEPLVLLFVIGVGIAIAFKDIKDKVRILDLSLLLMLPFVFLIVISSQTGFNHHMRYILPSYPFLVIIAGRLVSKSNKVFRSIALITGFFVLFEALLIHPHAESYFNSIAGGPEHGHDYLVDSNIDWGQDLLGLKVWLDRHPEATPLGLAYFGSFDPRFLGIDYYLPLPGPSVDDEGLEFGPRPGWYAISISYLRGISYNAPDGLHGWKHIVRHDYFNYFKQFEPIDRIGYSINIYHISLDQANSQRKILGLPLLVE